MKISRLNSIEQYVMQKETVSIDELCEVFGVSKNTIRRDLNELEARGHIAKVYGGVTAVKQMDIIPMPVRSNLNHSNKELIGALAAKEVQDGDTIFIDSGSTVVCMLKHLQQKKRITIVTHSLAAMVEASKYENLNLISLGGIYTGSTGSFVGISTLESISDLRITKAFMAATGVSLENGMTNTTFLEAEIKRGIVARSNKIVIMADSSKIDSESMLTFCHMSDISAFVTDKRPPEKYIAFCRENGVKILCEDMA